jgi:hypothetical protein
MKTEPSVKLEYTQPHIPNSNVNTQDDVDSVLRGRGLIQTRVYAGTVNVGGTGGTVFPFSWSVTHNSTGNYTITHNLGTLNYVVVATPANVAAASDTVIGNITTKATDHVQITWATTTGVPIDQYFEFILVTVK